MFDERTLDNGFICVFAYSAVANVLTVNLVNHIAIAGRSLKAAGVDNALFNWACQRVWYWIARFSRVCTFRYCSTKAVACRDCIFPVGSDVENKLAIIL